MGTMTTEYVTRAEFIDLKAEVDELAPMLRNFVLDQKRFVSEQRTFLANQELRDKEFRRQVRGLQKEDAELRDSVRDLSGEAAKAEMIRMKGELDRKNSLIRALKEDKKETRGWVVWAVRAAVPGAAVVAWELFRYLFWKGP